MNNTPDYSDLQKKNDSLNLAGRHLYIALEKEEKVRRIYQTSENKFITDNFIALNKKEISVKAYNEKKKMELFQFKLDFETARTVRYMARVEYGVRQEDLNTLKKQISIQ